MLGAIFGDIVGSPYEQPNIKGYSLPLWLDISKFTDDTVMMVAIADAMLNQRDFEESLRDWCDRYPGVGYGSGTQNWLADPDLKGYGSTGNSAAIRGLVVGMLHQDENTLMAVAEAAVDYSHNSEEAILYAQAVAKAAFMAKQGHPAKTILDNMSEFLDVTLDFDLSELHANYEFSAVCSKSVPQALYLGLTANSLEDCLRNGIYIGGDTDSILAVAAGIAGIFYSAESLPQDLSKNCLQMMDVRGKDLLLMAQDAEKTMKSQKVSIT